MDEWTDEEDHPALALRHGVSGHHAGGVKTEPPPKRSKAVVLESEASDEAAQYVSKTDPVHRIPSQVGSKAVQTPVRPFPSLREDGNVDTQRVNVKSGAELISSSEEDVVFAARKRRKRPVVIDSQDTPPAPKASAKPAKVTGRGKQSRARKAETNPITNNINNAKGKQKPARQRKRKSALSEPVHTQTVQHTNALDPIDRAQQVQDAFQRLQQLASNGQIVHVESRPSVAADYRELSLPLPNKIWTLLKDRGIERLYSHQIEAVEHVLNGASVVTATPTASGKSLIYTVPVLESLINMPGARALFLFPLKALARDQLRMLESLLEDLKLGRKQIKCYSYDGDTPTEQRQNIRKKAQIIMTNPDMLHVSILPYHKPWTAFFENLKYVIVDEAHIYKGVFGSHVELVMKLTSLPRIELVEGTGAPAGGKQLICWQPPISDSTQAESGTRSIYLEAADILVELMCAGLQTLCFVEARKLTEIICSNVRDLLKKKKMDYLASKVESYRAGYSPEERRGLEQRLASGQLRAVVATNALELGIDAGRAGRRNSSSLAVFLAHQRPWDQHFMRHPKDLFVKSCEKALVDAENPLLLSKHITCAASEVPVTDEDYRIFGNNFFNVRDALVRSGDLLFDALSKGYRGRYSESYASEIAIRGRTRSECYKVYDESGSLVEEVEGNKASETLYPGAFFHHGAMTYEITAFDEPQKKALAQTRRNAVISTASPAVIVAEPKIQAQISILQQTRTRSAGNTGVHIGQVRVVQQVVGFRKKHILSNKLLVERSLTMPPVVFETSGTWWDVAVAMQALQANNLDLQDALSGVKTAIAGILPNLAMCDRGDLGIMITSSHEQTAFPQVFIFGANGDDFGIALKASVKAKRGRLAYEDAEDLWRRLMQTVQECPCTRGCPACIQVSTDAALGKKAKQACIVLLENLLGERIRPQAGERAPCEPPRPPQQENTEPPATENTNPLFSNSNTQRTQVINQTPPKPAAVKHDCSPVYIAKKPCTPIRPPLRTVNQSNPTDTECTSVTTAKLKQTITSSLASEDPSCVSNRQTADAVQHEAKSVHADDASQAHAREQAKRKLQQLAHMVSLKKKPIYWSVDDMSVDVEEHCTVVDNDDEDEVVDLT
eukprot:jgi/Chlat1/1290/Chrsp118S01713